MNSEQITPVKSFYLYSNDDFRDFQDFVNTNRSKLLSLRFNEEFGNESIEVGFIGEAGEVGEND